MGALETNTVNERDESVVAEHSTFPKENEKVYPRGRW